MQSLQFPKFTMTYVMKFLLGSFFYDLFELLSSKFQWKLTIIKKNFFKSSCLSNWKKTLRIWIRVYPSEWPPFRTLAWRTPCRDAAHWGGPCRPSAAARTPQGSPRDTTHCQEDPRTSPAARKTHRTPRAVRMPTFVSTSPWPQCKAPRMPHAVTHYKEANKMLPGIPKDATRTLRAICGCQNTSGKPPRRH